MRCVSRENSAPYPIPEGFHSDSSVGETERANDAQGAGLVVDLPLFEPRLVMSRSRRLSPQCAETVSKTELLAAGDSLPR